ncbi:RHS repeat domain-containing protein, partial [Dysgonomonas termitidis]
CKDTIPVSNKVVKGVYASTGSYKRYNIQVDGVNKTFTNTPSILSVNFYDNYDFRGMAEIPASGTEYNPETGYGTWYGTDYSDANKYKNKGILTGTLTAQMNYDGTISSTPSSYLYSVMYYDSRGRLIQTKGNNQLAGGIEKEYIAYNFTGQPVKKLHVHTKDANGGGKLTELYTYTYDHAGRLLTTTHQLTDGTTVKPQVTLAENSYDDLGRLKTNKKGGVAGTLATYAYNVRSWTKSISSPLFTETLYYNESYGGSARLYNGNISAMSWKHNTETNPRGYAFVYDNLSRLTKASYLINGAVQTYNANTPTNPIYQTAYSYDKHGNMKTLQRYGNIDAAKYGLIDNLTMTYVGNQMTRVDEAAAAISIAESMDFKNGSNVANEYTYNANGAMNKDLNKGITEIQYNSLNLPRQMIINSSSVKAKNYYTYSASGVKLRTEQRYDPNYTVTPSNATNPTNDGLADYKNTDYAGNIIYETVKSGSTITNKTRILVSGGYIEGGVYYYYLTDHLGNNRVVANASGTVIQRNHYYPFGMSFADTPLAEQGKQPYKYNNKELDQMHGLNMYDYSARYLALDVPRFTTVDPLAEKYYSWSPYCYVGNNPLRLTDPTGMDWEDEKSRKYAEKLSADMSNRVSSLNKERQTVANNYVKALKSGDSEKAGQLLAEGLGLRASIEDLESGITELTAMGDTKDQTFAFKKISGNEGSTEKRDGVIEMQVTGTSIGVHESAHGYDLWKGGGITRSNFAPREIKAYGRQFSYDKSSLPNSYWGGISNRSNITEGWVYGVYNEVGGVRNYLYADKLLENSRVQYTSAAVERLLDQRRKSGLP